MGLKYQQYPHGFSSGKLALGILVEETANLVRLDDSERKLSFPGEESWFLTYG